MQCASPLHSKLSPHDLPMSGLSVAPLELDVLDVAGQSAASDDAASSCAHDFDSMHVI